MHFHADTADAKRVAKILRKRLAAAGESQSLPSCQDLVARLYGFAHWRELSANAGREKPSLVDEEADTETVAARRQRHVDILTRSFPHMDGKIQAVVDDVRPTASRTGGPVPDAPQAEPTADVPEDLLRLLLGDVDPRTDVQKAAAAMLTAHLLGAGIADLGATWIAELERGADDVPLPGAAFYASAAACVGLFAGATVRPLHFATAEACLRMWEALWPFTRSPEGILACLRALSEAAADGRTLEDVAAALSRRAGASWNKTRYDGERLARHWRAFVDDLFFAIPGAVSVARDPRYGRMGIMEVFEKIAKNAGNAAARELAEEFAIDDAEIFRIATTTAPPETYRLIAQEIAPSVDFGPDADARWADERKRADADKDLVPRSATDATVRPGPAADAQPSSALPSSFRKLAEEMDWKARAGGMTRELLMAGLLVYRDLDALGWDLNDEIFPVATFLGAHRRGLNLLDLGTTWLRTFSEAVANQAPDPEDKLVVDPEKLLSMALEGVRFEGKHDDDLARYVQSSELVYPFKFLSFLAGDDEGTDVNGGLRRLAEAHAAGITMEDLARAAWTVLDIDGYFEDYRDNPEETREDWTIDEIRAALVEDAEAAGLNDPSEPLPPDYDDPFAVRPKDAKRKVECLHCGDTYPAGEVVYERRFGSARWWCRNATCDGAGLGFDLHFTASAVGPVAGRAR